MPTCTGHGALERGKEHHEQAELKLTLSLYLENVEGFGLALREATRARGAGEVTALEEG